MTDAWSAENYNKNAAFVSVYGEEIFSWLAPEAGEKILDLGCGEGTLATKLMAWGVTVVGVDASQAMVTAAQNKGVNASVMDATALSFHSEFDAVFSNAVLHWVKPPEKAIEGIYNALKPGGRFVAEFGGKGNVEALQTALIHVVNHRGKDGNALNPWYFPSPEEYTALLEKQGFHVEKCVLFERPTPLPTGIDGWLKTFAHPFLSDFSEEEKNQIITEVIEAVRPKLCNAQGEWSADYVRLRVSAVKQR